MVILIMNLMITRINLRITQQPLLSSKWWQDLSNSLFKSKSITNNPDTTIKSSNMWKMTQSSIYPMQMTWPTLFRTLTAIAAKKSTNLIKRPDTANFVHWPTVQNVGLKLEFSHRVLICPEERFVRCVIVNSLSKIWLKTNKLTLKPNTNNSSALKV